MKKTILLIALFLLLPGTLLADDIIKSLKDMRKEIQMKPCEINVTKPVYNQWCYINKSCPVEWDTSNIKNWGSVFLIVVQIDAAHIEGWEGGGYPVPNTGNYQWIVPANVGPLANTIYQIKVITPDHKCSGKSRVFGIKEKLELPKLPVKQLKK
jgi:hypothetical protein